MIVKIEGENRFVKNTKNQSLVNTDITGLKEYKIKKEMTTKVNALSGEINTMKTEMSEIKSLLQQLVKQTSEK